MGSPAVYVACPLGQRTAGPEALTLLVQSFRQRGVEAYLIPMVRSRGNAHDPEYASYDYEIAERIPPRKEAHFVLTEVSPIESLRELRQVPDANTWMLWLSVNFSPIPEARYFQPSQQDCSFFPPDTPDTTLPPLWPYDDQPLTGPLRTIRESYRRRGGRSIQGLSATAVEAASIAFAQRTVSREINFGAQSFYGQAFVRRHLQRDAFIITDYPRRAHVPTAVNKDPQLVAYNGKKGRWKIGEIAALLPEVNFVPVENMTYTQVCALLSRSSLYLEIGHLPGRDRLPREAALLGTPTVMLARGAGFCWQDFPIGERYRIPYTVDWAQNMAPVITEALADPAGIHRAQEPFVGWVRGEKARYEQAMDAWVERLTLS